MAAWLARRFAASIAIVWAVVTLTFFLVHLAPGDPFCGGSERPVPRDVCDGLRRQFGLDRPLLEQYVRYVRSVATGDLGWSWMERRPVAHALADKIPNTILLAGAALCLDFFLGLGIGVYQALRKNRLPDLVLGQMTMFLYSVPTFWLGLTFLLVFSWWLGWFPAGGMRNPALGPSTPGYIVALDVLWHLVLPATTLGLVGAASTARYQRAAMLEVLDQDYVRAARARGAGERRVVMRHALRNALLPLITLFGLAFPFLLTGAVLVETVFSWPGMGRLANDAISSRDYLLVTAATMVAGIMVVLGSFLADVMYALADPRIRVRST